MPSFQFYIRTSAIKNRDNIATNVSYSADAFLFPDYTVQFFFFFFFEKMRQYKEERKSNKQSETSGPLKISCRWFL